MSGNAAVFVVVGEYGGNGLQRLCLRGMLGKSGVAVMGLVAAKWPPVASGRQRPCLRG